MRCLTSQDSNGDGEAFDTHPRLRQRPCRAAGTDSAERHADLLGGNANRLETWLRRVQKTAEVCAASKVWLNRFQSRFRDFQ